MTVVADARWRPSRAGILNVYQYEDETLHFAGGRLLLRGVNGSGKSTAMNMLLPFLLRQHKVCVSVRACAFVCVCARVCVRAVGTNFSIRI